MQQVSLQAYEKIKPTIRGSYTKILNTLKTVGKPMSNNDLAKYMGTVPNKVSGRTGEMIKNKMIYVYPRKQMNENGYLERLYWINWDDERIKNLFRQK